MNPTSLVSCHRSLCPRTGPGGPFPRSRGGVLIPVLLLGLASQAVRAGDGVWQAGGPSYSWATAGNWQGGVIPGTNSGSTNADTAFISGMAGNITVDSNRNLRNLTFGTAAGPTQTNLNSGSLVLSAGGSVQCAPAFDGFATLSTGMTLQGNATISNSGQPGAALLLNTVTTAASLGNVTLTLSGSQATDSNPWLFNGAAGVIGQGTATTLKLVKSGTGSWQVGGTNTFSGGTTLAGGILVIGNSNALGDSGTIEFLSDTTLRMNTAPTDPSGRILIRDGVAATIDTANNSLTWAAPFQVGAAGTGSLVKTGPGTLTIGLTGGAVQQFTGGLAVRAGTLSVDYSVASSATANILPATLPVTLAGGSLSLKGATSGSVSQTFGGLTLAAGVSNFTTSTGTVTTNFGTLVRGAGALLNLTTTAGHTYKATAAANDAGGVLRGVVFGANDWSTLTGGTIGTASYTTTNNASSWSSAANYRHNSGSVTGSVGSATINSLQLNSATSDSFNITSKLTVNDGILFGSSIGSHAAVISGGSVTGPANDDLIIVNNNGQNNSAYNNIASNIVNNGTTGLVVASFSGTLWITGPANSYTGDTTVGGSATVNVSGAGATLGSAGKTLRVNGYGTATKLQVGNGGTNGDLMGRIRLDQGTLSLNRADPPGAPFTLTADLTGTTGAGTLSMDSSGSATVTLVAGANNFWKLAATAAGNLTLSGADSFNYFGSVPAGVAGSTITYASGTYYFPGQGNSGGNLPGNYVYDGATAYFSGGRYWHSAGGVDTISAGTVFIAGDRWDPGEAAAASTVITINLSGSGKLVIPVNQYGINLGSGGSAVTLNQSGGLIEAGLAANPTNVSTGAGNLTIGQTNTANRHAYNLSGGTARLSGTLSGSGAPATGGTNAFNWTGGTLTARTITMTYLASNDGIHSSSAGTLYQAGGTLAPGEDYAAIPYRGLTAVTGNYTIDSGAMAIGLGGTTAAASFHDAPGKYDKVTVTGTATLGGDLLVRFANGFVPKTDDYFTILTAGSIGGTFHNVEWGSRMLTADGLASFIPLVEGNAIVLRYFDWHGDAPQITTQPNSITVLTGKTATFTVQLTGKPPFVYQWYQNGSPVAGATLPWFTIGSASAADAGNYSIVVGNSAGSVTSSTATLAVSASSSAFQQLLYRMDQTPVTGTGAITDASGLTSGTLLNAPAPLVCAGARSDTGTAWDFSQSSSYVQVAAGSFLNKLGDIQQTTGMTVGCWVNLDYQAGGSMNNANLFGMGTVANAATPNVGNAQLVFTFGTAPALSTSTSQLDGNWHHMVATIDYQKQTNNLLLFVDGVVVSTKSFAVTASFTSPGTGLGIGALNNGFHSWPGQIDEFSIFDRALLASEVTSLYNTGTIATPAPMVAVGADRNTIQWPGESTTTLRATVTPSVSGTWTKTSGPTATLASPGSANSGVTFSGPGSYVFRYTATTSGVTNYGETVITVLANAGPVITSALASPVKLAVAATNRTVNLKARARDDGFPNPPGMLTSIWSQLSGPAAVTISYPDLWETPASVPAVAGSYVLAFSVTDGLVTTTANVTIEVADNLEPTVTAVADANTLVWNGSNVSTTLRGAIADDGRPLAPGQLTGTWTQLSGPANATLATPSRTATNAGSLVADSAVSLPAIGQYVFRFTGSDGALTASATTWITVWAPGVVKVNAGASRLAWLPAAVLALTGAHTGNPGTATVAWSALHGPAGVAFSNPAALTTNATFSAAGKYQLQLKVSDGSYIGQDTLVVEVYEASQNFGYSVAELPRFTEDLKLNYFVEHAAWSRLAPPPPPYVHPRILFNPDDLPDLRQRLSTTTTSGPLVMTNIRASAARVTAQDGTWRIAYDALAAGDASIFNLQADRNGMTAAMKNEGFRALIDDDASGGAKAGAALATLADTIYQTLPSVMTPPVTDWRDKLQSPTYTDTLGWGYDFLYNYMTEAQRTAVRRALALMTNHVWNVGLDALPGFQANNSNWIPLTGQTLLYNTLAIEGEDGSDPDLALRYQAMHDRMCDSLAFPDGALYEGMGKGWVGIETYFALAKRGHKAVFSEMVRNHLRQFYLHCMETNGYGWTWDEVNGNSRGPANFRDVEVSKFLFPGDPLVDFVYRNACGTNFATSARFTGGGILEAICAENLSNPAHTWDQEMAQQVAPNAPLTQFFNKRGLLVTRSDWSANALRLLFQPRSEPGGHSSPDRNSIALSGLGRIWVPWYTYGSGSGYLPGDASMAASVVRVDNIGSSTLPATVVDYQDSADFTCAAGDAKACYGQALGGTATLANFTPNDPLFIKSPLTWENQKWTDMPHWYTSQKTTNYTQTTRAVSRAFRTACMVRGGGAAPYAVIADDIQLDSAAHNYKWRIMLDNDLTNVTVNGNDAIVTAAGGTTSLLVRLLSSSGTASFLTNNTYEWFSSPWLDIEVNSAAPDFKVLLLPFTNGTPLPTTTWRGNVLDVQRAGGQLDHLLFSPNIDGRTRVSFSRGAADNVPPVLTLPSDIVTTAASAQGSVVNFTATAIDAVDGPVPVVSSPPSGSLFPIGTTTVRCSANDTHLNGAGGTFNITVNPGSFALTAPTAVAQGGNTSAAVTWSAVAAATRYTVNRSTTSGSGFVTVASNLAGTRFNDASLTNGTTYYYKVTAVNGGGTGPSSNEVGVVPTALPAGWSGTNLGTYGQAGSGIIGADGSATLSSSATGMGGTSDSIYFAGQPWTGDGAIVVRVLGLQNATNSSRCGIMFRQSTAANSAFGFIGCQYYASDFAFVSRATAGASAVWGPGTHSSQPQWFKLVRSGSTLTGWQASNSSPGVQGWQQIGTAQVTLNSPMLAGLMLSSSATATLCTASFDHFAIYTAPTINPQAGLTLAATGPAGALVDFRITGQSNVDGQLVATCTPATGSIFPPGATTVAAVVTDSAGQSASTTFSVTVNANLVIPPVSPQELVAPAISLTGNQVNLIIRGTVAGRTYQLQRSPDLQAGSWLNVGSVQTGDGGDLTLSDVINDLAQRRFYRVRLGP